MSTLPAAVAHPDRLTIMRTLTAALICIVAITGCTPGESDAVVKSFQEYKSAILEQKGQVAVGLVTKGTVDEYQHYVDWALSADRQTLESLSFINRFQVFLLKHRIPADTLKQLNGQSVFAYAVDRDWIGKNDAIRTTLGKVDVANSRATAEVLIGGKRSPNRFQFLKEDGRWKFDLIQVIRDTDHALKAAAKKQGATEDEFMFSLIETVSGKRVEDAIWNPIQKVEPDGAGNIHRAGQ
ncbi:MAG TPA: hypothetical protein VEH04_07515 [Verrucomicrobiae bacterium]|nr:hypothetical protein [Verrucomicrobiae bacterium]